MPIPFGAIASLAGPLLGGLFGGNKQTTTSNQTSSGNNSARQFGNISDFNFAQGTEDPLLGGARGSILNALMGQMEAAQGPVFGQNEIASFLNQTNDAFGGAAKNVAANLAATGSLNSGRAAAVQGDLANSRASSIGQFYNELPFREKEAQLQRMLPLLQTGLNFVGRGVQGQFGRSNREVDMNNLSEFFSKQNSTQTTKGGGGATGLANLAGFLGGGELRNRGGIGSVFGDLFGGGNSSTDLSGYFDSFTR